MKVIQGLIDLFVELVKLSVDTANWYLQFFWKITIIAVPASAAAIIIAVTLAVFGFGEAAGVIFFIAGLFVLVWFLAGFLVFAFIQKAIEITPKGKETIELAQRIFFVFLSLSFFFWLVPLEQNPKAGFLAIPFVALGSWWLSSLGSIGFRWFAARATIIAVVLIILIYFPWLGIIGRHSMAKIERVAVRVAMPKEVALEKIDGIFNPATGKAEIFYERPLTEFSQFFKGEGFNPVSGKKIEPATYEDASIIISLRDKRRTMAAKSAEMEKQSQEAEILKQKIQDLEKKIAEEKEQKAREERLRQINEESQRLEGERRQIRKEKAALEQQKTERDNRLVQVQPHSLPEPESPAVSESSSVFDAGMLEGVLVPLRLAEEISTETAYVGRQYLAIVDETIISKDRLVQIVSGDTASVSVLAVERPGRTKGSGYLILGLNRIGIARVSPNNAVLKLEAKSGFWKSLVKVGAGAGVGAAVGAVVGGKKGAAAGAAAGAAIMTVGILATRGKDLVAEKEAKLAFTVSGEPVYE